MNRTRRAAAVAGVALLISATAACGSGGSTGSTGGGDTLAIGLQMSLPSLNPVLSPISPTLVYAYDPLIYRANDGSYVPDLATKWGYVGSGNRTFELTLRSGAKFSDGTPLTAQAVKNSIDYFLKTPNSNLAAAGPVSAVKAVGQHTVRITYKSAFPNAVDSLTQFWGIGLIIGPKGLASPKSLETSTDGVGQYNLDASATRTGSVYTFVAGKTYFSQSAIRYKKIQIRTYATDSARLNALKSGQIQDATQISLGQTGVAAANGFQQLKGNTTWMVAQFLDTKSGPLASKAVRQALSYAIDRNTIVKDFYGGFAVAQDQFTPRGLAGYSSDLDNAYSYDTAKAKQLLSSAGYTKGFTLKLLTDQTADPGGSLGQVLRSQLAKIGVKVELTVNTGTFPQLQSKLASGTYDAALFNLASVDLYSTATQSIVSPKSLLNPSSTADPTAMRLLNAAATASGTSAIQAALVKLNAYLTGSAVGLPIVTRTNVDLISTDVALPAKSYVTPQPTMIGPAASYAFAAK